MRKFLVLSLALCVLCELINVSSAHPLLDKLGIASKRQLSASCVPGRLLTCFRLNDPYCVFAAQNSGYINNNCNCK